ncbi:CBS domain-containing protein [Desulfitispora alkaliphila]|uniref:CBS domain-containing protein n=1 Tax=Desulfitispora alkaliphila TaxID=622674 RepID=UPI003D1AFCD0
MIIAFFLTPKQDVIWLSEEATMRQALEKMEYHRYSAIPLIDEEGRYTGTITEGDLLWKLKNTKGLKFENTNRIMITEVPQHMNNKVVRINEKIDSLIDLAKTQNFVPVVDDNGVFIGIVKRGDIIEYCAQLINARGEN